MGQHIDLIVGLKRLDKLDHEQKQGGWRDQRQGDAKELLCCACAIEVPRFKQI
ncbi:hypothetical protein D3C73_700360 [compost metagenome]